MTRAIFLPGRFVEVDDRAAVLALPNDIQRQKCEERRPDVEAVLAAHFGRPVPLRLVVDTGAGAGAAAARGPAAPAAAPAAPAPVHAEEHIDLDDLSDAPDAAVPSDIDRLTAVFPGAELIEEDS
jgi:hypothetical protein